MPPKRPITLATRWYSSGKPPSNDFRSRRSMLYVPGSSEKMIKKSQTSPADCIIFDLEDSVAPNRKGLARETVFHALEACARPGPELAVRINPPSGDRGLSGDDLDMVLQSQQLETIVVPKVESEEDIRFIVEKAKALRASSSSVHPDAGQEGGGHHHHHRGTYSPLNLVLSVESAASLLRMPTIVEKITSELESSSSSNASPVRISALLFASEDYCASTGILRTRSRRELLFPRAQMATIARAYGLQAIDMVCVDYRDQQNLSEECIDGRELGFDGKQAIHPVQVETIQSKFSPSEQEILKAARIKHHYERSLKENKGAYGLKQGDSMVMIDAPMLLQAEIVLNKARSSGLEIPDVSKEE
ncbi:beta subunit of citrate lyase [Violaceomyces palustris]|uniref:Beta subunit of citrate lyase n=1 Tax=Violaceomyces palustris TaxID=1673888 RepID=A0ACD0NTE8_9BASI|nr:beta subunit of citrate lyase [Violaceomyces palustris]